MGEKLVVKFEETHTCVEKCDPMMLHIFAIISLWVENVKISPAFAQEPGTELNVNN